MQQLTCPPPGIATQALEMGKMGKMGKKFLIFFNDCVKFAPFFKTNAHNDHAHFIMFGQNGQEIFNFLNFIVSNLHLY